MMERFAFQHLLVVAVLALTAASLAVPAPVIAYQCNPDEVNKTNYIPTTDPLVISTIVAFVCYMDIYAGNSFCQMISPANAAFTAPRVMLPAPGAYAGFDVQPIALSSESALFASTDPQNSYFAASSPYIATNAVERFNSTSRPTANAGTATGYVPFGVHQGLDILASFNFANLSEVTHNFFLHWNHSATDNTKSLLHNLVQYRGSVLFMHNNTFYSYNAAGQKVIDVNDPCGVGAQVGYRMDLTYVTYGSDANGPLDAFLVFGNTSANGRAGFVMCRVSHLTGQRKWVYNATEDVSADDIIGGGGLVLLSGQGLSNGQTYVTVALNVTSGSVVAVLQRSEQDAAAYPVFFPGNLIAPWCGSAFMMQVNGNATVYCVSNVTSSKLFKPIWVSPSPCITRGIFDSLTGQFVCIKGLMGVISFKAIDGSIVWVDESKYTFKQPILLQEDGVSYAFVIDADATLWGFQIALPFTPTPPPTTPTPQQGSPAGGLSGGAKAAVVIVVIAVAAVVAVAAFMYFQRKKSGSGGSRTAINAESTHEYDEQGKALNAGGGYGGLA